MRGLILFEFPSGSYGFWDGDTPFVFNRVTYQPGKPISLEDINSSAALDAQGLQVTVTSIPAEGLTTDVLATIEGEDYTGRLVTLHTAYFSPTGVLWSVERVWRGYVDGFDHVDQVGGQTKLVARLESKALDNSKQGYRKRSPADQAKIFPGDNGLDHVAIAGSQELDWGRLPEKPNK